MIKNLAHKNHRCPECKSEDILMYEWVPGHAYCIHCGVGHHESDYFRLSLYEDYELWLKERWPKQEAFLNALERLCIEHGFQLEDQRDDVSFVANCDGEDDYDMYFSSAPYDYWYRRIRPQT